MTASDDQDGFVSLVVIILAVIVLAVIGGTGYRIWRQHSKPMMGVAVRKYVAQQNNRSTVDSAERKYPNCVDQSGGSGEAGTDTLACTYNSVTYTLPAIFNSQNIENLNMVPAAARPVVIVAAKKAYDEFLQAAASGTVESLSRSYAGTAVLAAQNNFIELSNGNPEHMFDYFVSTSVTDGKWLDTGATNLNFQCNIASQYKLTQPTQVYYGPAQTTCTASGSWETIKLPKS